MDEPRDPHREVYDPLTWTKTSVHLFAIPSGSEADDDVVASIDIHTPGIAGEVPPPRGFLMLSTPPAQTFHADTPSTNFVPPPLPSPAAPFHLTET